MGGRLLRASVLVALVATSQALAQPAVAQPFAPKIESITVERVAALTGPDAPSDMQTPDVCGTDIGTMAELTSGLSGELSRTVYFAFGDTFGYRRSDCPPGPGGPNWRSNVLAATTDLDAADGIAIEWWYAGEDGKAIAVTEGAHRRAFSGPAAEQTRIPTAMVAVGGRLYLHYMSVHGFAAQGGVWLCNRSAFVYSDDAGKRWTEARGDFGGHSDTFNMLALSAQPGAGNTAGNSSDNGADNSLGDSTGEYVYALGTPCGRFGGARVGRVPAEQLLEPGAWEYYTGAGWSGERSNAIEVILPPVGEGSLMWNAGLGRWLYSYLNESSAAIELREAEQPWGPWSEPHVLATGAEYPALYGAYMSPAYLADDGRTFYFVMSQFGPYDTFVMKATLEVRGGE